MSSYSYTASFVNTRLLFSRGPEKNKTKEANVESDPPIVNTITLLHLSTTNDLQEKKPSETIDKRHHLVSGGASIISLGIAAEIILRTCIIEIPKVDTNSNFCSSSSHGQYLKSMWGT